MACYGVCMALAYGVQALGVRMVYVVYVSCGVRCVYVVYIVLWRDMTMKDTTEQNQAP